MMVMDRSSGRLWEKRGLGEGGGSGARGVESVEEDVESIRLLHAPPHHKAPPVVTGDDLHATPNLTHLIVY